MRVQPARRLKCGAADQQAIGAGYDLVVAVAGLMATFRAVRPQRREPDPPLRRLETLRAGRDAAVEAHFLAICRPIGVLQFGHDVWPSAQYVETPTGNLLPAGGC